MNTFFINNIITISVVVMMVNATANNNKEVIILISNIAIINLSALGTASSDSTSKYFVSPSLPLVTLSLLLVVVFLLVFSLSFLSLFLCYSQLTAIHTHTHSYV